MTTILVVDDDLPIRTLFIRVLRGAGYVAIPAAAAGEALAHARGERIDIVLMDWKLREDDGIETFRHMRRARPELRGLLVTAYTLGEADVNAALQAGFGGYVRKPVALATLLGRVEELTEGNPWAAPADSPVPDLQPDPGREPFETMVGASAAMRRIFSAIDHAARLSLPVLIQGETGTGKELVARAIHRRSRREGPFEALNCGAVPESLAEAELFGHERGAFTGADERRTGLFERANRGTLLLDEVGEMPHSLQVKLLRALETQEVSPIGGRHPVSVDARIIAATNVPLDAAVDAGRFRKDLYWRLNAIRIDLPPVRDRQGDLPQLVDCLLGRVRHALQRSDLRLSASAMALVAAHSWPGNVREMEQTLVQAALAARGETIEAEDLPPTVTEAPAGLAPADFVLPPGMTLEEALAGVRSRLEPVWIADALAAHAGNHSRAAQALGINRKTLYEKIRKYRLATR